MTNCAHINSKLSNDSTISGPGVPSVLVNGIPISVVTDNVTDGDTIVEGSPTVFADGKSVVRLGDNDSENHTIDDIVSPDVFINGA